MLTDDHSPLFFSGQKKASNEGGYLKFRRGLFGRMIAFLNTGFPYFIEV